MNDIQIERDPSDERLRQLGVESWGIWTKEASKFPWQYDSDEVCYFLEGDVTVTPENGTPVRMAKGDLARFPTGMVCTWEIHSAVKKYYRFE